MKKISRVIILILLFSFMFGLTGQSMANNGICQQAKEFQFTDLTIAHGGSAVSSWLLFAEGIASIIREEMPGSRVTVIPGGSDANIAMLQRGEVDFAITTTDSANTAINGREAFPEPVPMDDVNTIAFLYFAKIHFVVLNNVGVDSFEDIKQKKIPLRISVGSRGSGMEIAGRRILGEYGITYDDIEKWGGSVVYFGQTDSIRMLGDGQLNAYISLSAVPLAGLTELSINRDFKILVIREDLIEKMIKEYDYTFGVIPAGSYKGVEEDITTLCVANGLFASGSLDEQTAYLVTKALVDNIDRLRQIHSQLKDLTPEFMELKMVFPLHPGAKRAYQK